MRRRFIISILLFPLALSASSSSAKTIRVKIVVDEEERMVNGAWQQRLQRRIERASQVINSFCDLKFGVVAFERWDSDDRLTDLSKSLRELETEISPKPGEIAIGFTSQYRFQPGHNTLGGTRGPLHPYILIREGARNIDESERIEAVIHELGHYLGAAHSNDPNSVMRTTLGTGRKPSMIGFDKENARIIRLVSSDMIDLRAKRIYQLSGRTREALREHYVKLAKQLPKDKAAPRFLEIIDRSLQVRPY